MSVKFTRRHYVVVAESLTHIEDERIREEQALNWCRTFQQDNPRFKKDRFLEAAKVKA
jgi:hypothetical protein